MSINVTLVCDHICCQIVTHAHVSLVKEDWYCQVFKRTAVQRSKRCGKVRSTPVDGAVQKVN